MKQRARILIVEDDATIRTILEMALMGAGFRHVSSCARGDEGLQEILRTKPDLVLLDVMLPGLDGFTLARRVRGTPALAATRILMLTARSENEDIVRGLEAGADDYVTKPFDRLVLLARVRAVLRRGLPETEGVDFDGLLLDEPNRLAKLNGEALKLSAGEFDLLVRLVAHRGRILTRAADERTVDVHILRLRKQLSGTAAQDLVQTVRGVGYKVVEPMHRGQ